MCSYANFRTVLPDSENTQTHMPITRHTLTQNGHSRSFKVIYFGVNEKPLRDYISRQNIVILFVKVRKIYRAK